MLLSKSCDYGIRASLYIASRENVRYATVREISGHLNVSFHFLTKILQKLTSRAIIRSFKGRSGGVTLARPADAISLMEIILAIEGPAFFKRCLLGLEYCSEEDPCPIHHDWESIRRSMQSVFEKTTLAMLAEKVRKEGRRISDLTLKTMGRTDLTDASIDRATDKRMKKSGGNDPQTSMKSRITH